MILAAPVNVLVGLQILHSHISFIIMLFILREIID